MGDIQGIGYGCDHDWENRGTSIHRTTHYKCRRCGCGFWHAYNDTPNIFKAMKLAGVPKDCTKEHDNGR